MIMLLYTVSTLLVLFLASVASITTQTACDPFEVPLRNSNTTSNSKLPNPFRFLSGKNVTTKSDWGCRRKEIIALLEEWELGTIPPAPSIQRNTLSANKSLLHIEIEHNGKSISMDIPITLPPAALLPNAKPVPALLALNAPLHPVDNSSTAIISYDPHKFSPAMSPQDRGRGLFYTLHGRNHPAGGLAAQVWLASRILDALESLGPSTTKIDPTRIGTTGCSRNGRLALYLGALDSRIALTIAQEALGGAAGPWRSYKYLCRGICIPLPNSAVWDDTVFWRGGFPSPRDFGRFPYDHHELVALVAPRGLYMPHNQLSWLDYEGAWLGARAGGMVWEALGVRGGVGYDASGSYNHCRWNETRTGDLEAFVDRFLFGKEVGNRTEIYRPGSPSTSLSRWVNWTLPMLKD